MTQARQSCTFRFLDELLNDVHNGRLIIQEERLINPSFWDKKWKFSSSPLDLIESIAHNIPIGSIVIYEKDGKDYVLDGHHRLFHLYNLLYSDFPKIHYRILYNLEKSTFYYQIGFNENMSLHYIPVSLLLNNIELIRYQRKLNNESMIAKSDALSTTFRNHQVAVYRMKINSDAEIKNAYELINENRKTL